MRVRRLPEGWPDVGAHGNAARPQRGFARR
jgi:hypothetical protein